MSMQAARDDNIMADAMSSHMKDWRSAGDTREGYMRTWIDLHTARWDVLRRPALPALPLTPPKIHVIGALLKLG